MPRVYFARDKLTLAADYDATTRAVSTVRVANNDTVAYTVEIVANGRVVAQQVVHPGDDLTDDISDRGLAFVEDPDGGVGFPSSVHLRVRSG